MKPEVLAEKDGKLVLFPQYFPEQYEVLKEVLPWTRNKIRVFGKLYDEPRLTYWCGPAYKYSNISWPETPFHPILDQIRRDLNERFDFEFNAVLVNFYRDGNDAMGWHRDNEPEMDTRLIASISFGATRNFRLRHREDGTKLDVPLASGDLLIMEDMQHHWEHSIPRSKRVTEGRINLTFRRIREA